MKAYKVEILIIDFDDLGSEEIESLVENARYPNHCINPSVKSIEERDIGEWDDNHPLNKMTTSDAEYERLFGLTTNQD